MDTTRDVNDVVPHCVGRPVRDDILVSCRVSIAYAHAIMDSCGNACSTLHRINNRDPKQPVTFVLFLRRQKPRLALSEMLTRRTNEVRTL